MPIDGLRGADRVVASAISEGLGDYLQSVDHYNSLLARLVQASAVKTASERRLMEMLERDAKDREEEQRRRIALADLEAGIETNVADALVKPTPEQLRDPAFITRKVAAKHWADGGLTGFRRMVTSQIIVLHSRGVLTDDTVKACKWYRDRWELARMEPSAPVAQYGETVRGDPDYGHLPHSQMVAEAKDDIRDARKFIPGDMLNMFENVICHDLTMKSAARAASLRYVNFSAAFKLTVDRLYDGISYRLEMLR
jgi:hypothetical protein